MKTITTPVLLSSKLRAAVNALSCTITFNTRVLNTHGSKVSKTSQNYTTNDMRVVIGANHNRRSALKRHGIPGWLFCAWAMDKPITKHWLPKVNSLAKELGVVSPIDNYEGA